MQISIQQSKHLQAVAILMMLFLHLFNRSHENLFSPLLFIGDLPLSYYISLFCDSCVPIFAFVSGYGLYYKYLNNKGSFNRDNLLRLKKMYINYWVVLLLFAVILGLLLSKEGYPGDLMKFLGNVTAFNPSYNGAWWFFTIYVLFILTSRFWFYLLDKIHPILYIVMLFVLYLVGFYFRIYNSDLFSNIYLHYFHTQSALFFCTLFQFMLGAFALKYNDSCKFLIKSNNFLVNNLIFIIGVFVLIIIHAFIPNFVIAPFIGIIFIALFINIKLPNFISKLLDALSVHTTNMWLIHMFFYLIYFQDKIYRLKFPLIIYLALIILCLISSIVVNQLVRLVIKK